MSESIREPEGGPWGDLADVVLCLFPLVFLIVVTLSQRFRMATVASLPLAALMMWFVRLVYLGSKSNPVHAAVITGVLDALTPLCIIGGAILLFSTMQHTMCLPWIVQKIKKLSSGHPVAEVFLIGWAFAYLIEGASGFGTPVALAAPMLAELGHSPMNSVLCVLIMNTLATPYGAVGTPIWFGFDEIGLSSQDFLDVSFRVSVIDGVVAIVVPVMAASTLISWKDLWRSKFFVLLSISSCVLPAIGVSAFSYEFGSMLGGIVGTCITAVLAQAGIGLGKVERAMMPTQDEPPSPVAVRISLLPGEKSEEHVDMPRARKDANSRPAVVRRSSVNVASLAFPSHMQREDSFESAPGDFLSTSPPERVNNERNRLLFPITYDPLNFSKRLVSRGCQTAVADEIEALTIPEPQTEPVAYEDLEVTDAAAMSRNNQPIEELDIWDNSSPIVQGIKRTFPLWATVVLLIITRLPQLGIKDLLQSTKLKTGGQLGSLGVFEISPSLVIALDKILGEADVRWQFQLLYVPFILPFVAVSCLTLLMFRGDIRQGLTWMTPFQETILRIKNVVVALVGALVLVNLIRKGGDGSPAYIVGFVLAKYLKDGFIVFAPLLGCLGSFFSGSTTVSNLTFGTVQLVAAEQMGTSTTGMLALQCMGATMGNMICINNIISARTVLGLEQGEGEFIKRTAPAAVVFYVVGTLVGLIFVL